MDLKKPSSSDLDLYMQGYSARQIAAMLGTSKSQIAKNVKAAGLSRTRSKAAQLRQPALSKHWRTTRCTARRIWERNVGPIPKGYHIHHKNGDHTDNHIENLECLLAREHLHKHRPPNLVPKWKRPHVKEYMRIYMRKYLKTYKRPHAKP